MNYASAVFLTFATIFCSYASAAETQTERANKSVESLLDRLEKQMLDNDREANGFDQKSTGASKKEAPSRQIKMKPAEVSASISEEDNIQTLATTLSELEKQVESLAGEIQRTKQTILEQAKVDNYVTISLSVDNPEDGAINRVQFKIDGFTVYATEETSGSIVPSGRLAVYTGPLSPGKHSLEFNGNIVLRQKAKLSLDEGLSSSFSSQNEVNIGPDTRRQNWIARLSVPKTARQKANIEFAATTPSVGPDSAKEE